MRLLRIEMRAHLQPTNAHMKIETADLRERLHQELSALIPEISEQSRQRIASYFPGDYSVFVRMVPDPETNTVKVLIWVDDPTIRWPAGLLARRAWKLSVPVLAHAVSETFDQRFQGIAMQIDRTQARVSSFAPVRIWNDPLFLAAFSFVAASALWLYLVPITVERLVGVAGP